MENHTICAIMPLIVSKLHKQLRTLQSVLVDNQWLFLKIGGHRLLSELYNLHLDLCTSCPIHDAVVESCCAGGFTSCYWHWWLGVENDPRLSWVLIHEGSVLNHKVLLTEMVWKITLGMVFCAFVLFQKWDKSDIRFLLWTWVVRFV